ncbi:unnamed protein product [Hermetia illucens]|uniref:Ig-like domain-containing protein n=2 Tax=Hermetia illucens TaxID=343691 RepID=A0A7R8Z0R4_HERIL|nr:unnamed protein product [Hermetia illucens]
MRLIFVTVCIPVTLLLILSPATLGDDWTASCSTVNCTCKWTSGKKSAICSSLHLTTIPTTLSTEIQVLVLSDNYIPYLNREEFTSLGLVNLQRIYLKKSEIQYIHKESFKNLKILIEIDLSDNKIEMLDKETFSGNDRLRILYLNGNPLKRLIAYQFPILPHLRTLDLHDCLIRFIDPMAFANLNLLEFLYLKNNLLENLSEYVFQHMTNLKTLILDENPWLCDCRLRKFRSWYVRSKLNSVSLTCKGPFHHKDKQWENIDDEQFGCMPKVEIFSNEDVQNIDIGSNTTFSCLVLGDPLPVVTWELNGKAFDNDNVLFDEEIISSDKIWNNLTVFNMTSLDAGTYSCSAQNSVGFASQNISIYLTEIVQHVLVKTPETFWYFGLIMGTFGTVFLLILLSFVVCLCKRTRRRRHHNKNIKGSVSFNDQEKKLLDLSITTTNDRQDSCGIDNNTTTSSLNKTESVMAFEPIEITVENRNAASVGAVSNMNCGPSGMGLGAGSSGAAAALAGAVGGTASLGGGGNMVQHEEFPLNVGVFPPPPEFCSNVVGQPPYGNIFISVSVTQDMLDSSEINIYPDLLNIPKRVDSSSSSTMLPVNVSSFATLPRNQQRRGILKKDTATTLYPHDEIVSYHNLDTTTASAMYNTLNSQTSNDKKPSSSTSTCINCIRAQPHPYSKDDLPTGNMGTIPETTTIRQCSNNTPMSSSCLKYDNMGRRITASGNSTLSLPDEERMENETLFNETVNTLKTFKQTQTKHPSSIQSPSTTSSATASNTHTAETLQSGGSDFVSL